VDIERFTPGEYPRFLDESGEDVADINIINDATGVLFCVEEDFSHSSISRENWQKLGSVISQCKKLKNIIFRDFEALGENILTAVFQSTDGPYNFPLDHLSFENSKIGQDGIYALLPFIKSRKELNCLDLHGTDLGDSGAAVIGELLGEVRLNNLVISENPLSIFGINRIISAKNFKHLKTLGIHEIELETEEVEQIARVLKEQTNSLEKLSIGCEDPELQQSQIEWVEILLQSLKTNKTMKSLTIHSYTPHMYHLDPDLSDRLETILMSVVCDTASFSALCDSNHTLVVSNCVSPLATAINSHSGWSTNQKIRRKLQAIYFHGEFSVQDFLPMKTVWMPRVLELVSSLQGYHPSFGAIRQYGECPLCQKRNLNGMYKFIRHWNLPNLLSYPSAQVELKQLREKFDKFQSESDGRIHHLEGVVRELATKQLESDKEIQRLKRELSRVKLDGDGLSSKIENKRLITDLSESGERNDNSSRNKRSNMG